jgi:hypothetical protein
VVVIINGDQVAELQVSSSASCLASNTFHGTAIAKKDVGVVVDQIIARLVEDGTSVSLRNSKTDRVGETLT